MPDNSLKPHIILPEDADRAADWLRNSGGMAIWMSDDGRDLKETLARPVNTSTGDRAAKPVWWVADEPACVITDSADVIVSNDVEVKRFHVTVCRNGRYRIKSARRIRTARDSAGKSAYCLFDDKRQEAVIMKPEWRLPSLDFLRARLDDDLGATGPESDENPSTDSEKTVQAGLEEGDESSPAPLSKEQLGNLLNDLLDQVSASKPPVRASMDHQMTGSGRLQSQ